MLCGICGWFNLTFSEDQIGSHCPNCNSRFNRHEKEKDMLQCPFPPATLDQAVECGSNIYQYASGAEPWDQGCFDECAIGVLSYGNSVLFPDGCAEPPAKTAAAVPAKSRDDLKKELATALKPLADAKKKGDKKAAGSAVQALPWKNILQLLYTLLLSFLS